MNLFTQQSEPTMTLRPYQERCLAAVQDKFAEFDKSLLVVPTGGGKTIMFAALAQRFWKAKKRTLILAHREELIDQAVDKIFKATGIEAEVEKADRHASLDAPVVVGSVQTLMRDKRLDTWVKGHFGLVVADEAHHCLSDSWQKVLNHFYKCGEIHGKTNTKILGVTATPDRGDKRNLGKYFQCLADEITMLDLIRDGYLSRIKIKTIPIKIDLRNVKTIAGDYDAEQLGESLVAYLDAIAEALADHASFRKCLVFLPLIKTSMAFAEMCRARGLAAEHIDGMSPDRADILKRFADNKFDVLCNAMLLTEGYDCPDVDCIVPLRPTKVRSLYSQMVGRGTRVAPGKQDLLLLDFLWMHEKHDLVKPAHLIAKTETVAKEMQAITDAGDEVELEELEKRAIDQIKERVEQESEAKKQREAKLAEAIKENSGRTKKYIDAMEFCMSLHDVENMDYEPQFDWEKHAPTEKQLQAIANMGIDPTTISCKGHASKILDRAFTRRKLKLATPKQLLYLRRFGHATPDTATFEEATAFLDTKFKSNRVTFAAPVAQEEVPF